jgi:hypothetical protein
MKEMNMTTKDLAAAASALAFLLLSQPGCRPVVKGWYFDLDAKAKAYTVDQNCQPVSPIHIPAAQVGAPFGGYFRSDSFGNIRGLFVPAYPNVATANIQGRVQNGLINNMIVRGRTPASGSAYDPGGWNTYELVFNGSAHDLDGDGVADNIVMDTGKPNYAIVYDENGTCIAWGSTSTNENFLANDHSLVKTLEAYLRSLQNILVCFTHDPGESEQCGSTPIGDACVQFPIDGSVYVNWKGLHIEGDDLDEGVTIRLDAETNPAIPNDMPSHLFLGRWTAGDQGCDGWNEHHYQRGEIDLPLWGRKNLRFAANNLFAQGTLRRDDGQVRFYLDYIIPSGIHGDVWPDFPFDGEVLNGIADGVTYFGEDYIRRTIEQAVADYLAKTGG